MARVIATDGSKTIRYVSIPDRELAPGEVRLQTLFSGISQGTELRQYRQTSPRLVWNEKLRVYEGEDDNPSPRYLGYENVGEVVELGANCKSLAVGDVVWTPTPHQDFIIAQEPVAWDGLICRAAERDTLEDCLPLFTCCARARIACAGTHDAQLLLGEQVAVFGLGLVGCFIVQACLLSGASKVYAVDPFAQRRNFCASLGAVPIEPEDAGALIKGKSQKGVDKAVEVSGVIRALHQAVRSCRVGGTVVTVGTYGSDGQELFLGNEWSKNRITLRSSMTVNGCPSRSYPLWDLQRLQKMAIEMVRNSVLKPPVYSTQCFSFSRGEEAFRAADIGDPAPVHMFLRYVA